MADRIIAAKGLPDTPEVRADLERTIADAFDQQLPRERGEAGGRRLGESAFQTIFGKAARLWIDGQSTAPIDVTPPSPDTRHGSQGGDSGLKLWRLVEGGTPPPHTGGDDPLRRLPAEPDHP